MCLVGADRGAVGGAGGRESWLEMGGDGLGVERWGGNWFWEGRAGIFLLVSSTFHGPFRSSIFGEAVV